MNCETNEHLLLNGVGIFTILNKNCKTYTNNIISLPDLELDSTYQNKLVEFNVFEENCCVDDNLKFTVMLNPLQNLDPINTDLFKLPELSQKMINSKNRISDILSNPNPTKNFSFVTYTIAIVLFFFFDLIDYR